MKTFIFLCLALAYVDSRFVIPQAAAPSYGAPAPAAPVFKPQPLPQQFSPIASIFKPINRDCVYEDWSEYSACSAVACGTNGLRTRTRAIIKQSAGFGLPCDQSKLTESIPCAARACRDCVSGAWSAWSVCSASCGGGTQSRSKPTLSPHEGTGAGCDDFETQPCNLQSCAVDCVMSPYSQWSDCSASCGEGQRQRLRNILVQPKNGGRQCGPLEQWESCNAGPCPIPCQMGEWSSWSNCPACGEPTSRTRSRSIIQQAAFGGAQCADLSLFDSEQCNITPCPVDCQVSAWSPYSDCSASCGLGQQQRIRNILVQPAYGGLQCPPLEERQACNQGPCAVHCEVSQWSTWSACSAQCGPGSQSRTRTLLTRPANGGELCPELEDWQKCNNGPCVSNPLPAFKPALLPVFKPAPIAPAPVFSFPVKSLPAPAPPAPPAPIVPTFALPVAPSRPAPPAFKKSFGY